MKFWDLTLYLLARITLTLVSSPGIIISFRKVGFQGFIWVTGVIWKFEPSLCANIAF